jgi:hypothetical protein
MTQVRQNPATTENRRETVEGLKQRAPCIQRMYSSRCGRRAASGPSPRSAHQVRKQRRPDSVCSREEPVNLARQAATASRS